jgi:hypothetical protein
MVDIPSKLNQSLGVQNLTLPGLNTITKNASLAQEGEEGTNNVGIGSPWPSLYQPNDQVFFY